MATVPHTLAPEGPRKLTPAEFLLGVGVSEMVSVFQICFPVAESNATTMPRDVQHT
jgi:hypothetical protein